MPVLVPLHGPVHVSGHRVGCGRLDGHCCELGCKQVNPAGRTAVDDADDIALDVDDCVHMDFAEQAETVVGGDADDTALADGGYEYVHTAAQAEGVDAAHTDMGVDTNARSDLVEVIQAPDNCDSGGQAAAAGAADIALAVDDDDDVRSDTVGVVQDPGSSDTAGESVAVGVEIALADGI